MLASIHPLGERSRRQRWGVTAAAYVAATVAAAALLGATLGLAGSWLPSTPAPAAVVALALIGLVLDLRAAVPTIHRQVDEEWLSRYRGWVYGASFGFQLGLGVVTVVSSFTVYLAFALALLSGSTAAGLAIGTAFGLARGLTIFAAAGVRTPDHLRRLHRRVAAWDGATRRLAVGVQAVVAVGGGVAAAVRW